MHQMGEICSCYTGMRYSDGQDEYAIKRRDSLPRLSDAIGLLPEEVAKVQSDLTREGEDPAEFRVEVERVRDGEACILHLWHESAFLPESRNMVGNPGGRCRDIIYYGPTQTRYSIFWE